MDNIRKQALNGAFIGFIVGLLAGFGQLNMVKKSLRKQMLPYSLGIGGIVLACSGYSIGKKLGIDSEVENRLGIKSISSQLYKDGRFWFAETAWRDSEGQQHIIITKKNNVGTLCSIYNGSLYQNHNVNSGSQANVSKFHNLVKNQIILSLKQAIKNQIAA